MSYKFVPGGGQKIYEWYKRVLQRKEISADPEKITYMKQTRHIDFIISDHKIEEGNFLKLVFSNPHFFLYKVL